MNVCKRAPSTTIGAGHSLNYYINTPQWFKPPASTAASSHAASTACRSPRTVGDSPHTSTFKQPQAFFGSAGLQRVLTQEDSSSQPPQTHPRSPPYRFAAPAAITTPAASKSGHGSMRPRPSPKCGDEIPSDVQRGAAYGQAEGHLLWCQGVGTDCPNLGIKQSFGLPPAGAAPEGTLRAPRCHPGV